MKRLRGGGAGQTAACAKMAMAQEGKSAWPDEKIKRVGERRGRPHRCMCKGWGRQAALRAVGNENACREGGAGQTAAQCERWARKATARGCWKRSEMRGDGAGHTAALAKDQTERREWLAVGKDQGCGDEAGGRGTHRCTFVGRRMGQEGENAWLLERMFRMWAWRGEGGSNLVAAAAVL